MFTLWNFWYIYGLQQLIKEPTRITESSSSLINVIFTNCINRVGYSRVLHIGISNHSLISVCHKLSPEFAFKGIQLNVKDILVISIEKAIKSNNPQDWAMYKRLEKRINGGVKSTKASYYAGAFIQSNGNSRKTCQLINQLTSRKKNNASVKELKLNENSITNSHELSNAFNNHFSTTETKLAN